MLTEQSVIGPKRFYIFLALVEGTTNQQFFVLVNQPTVTVTLKRIKHTS